MFCLIAFGFGLELEVVFRGLAAGLIRNPFVASPEQPVPISGPLCETFT